MPIRTISKEDLLNGVYTPPEGSGGFRADTLYVDGGLGHVTCAASVEVDDAVVIGEGTDLTVNGDLRAASGVSACGKLTVAGDLHCLTFVQAAFLWCKGNITALGDLVSLGEIICNGKISAGSIFADGDVSAVEIEASGNLITPGAVVAHSRLRVLGDVHARLAVIYGVMDVRGIVSLNHGAKVRAKPLNRDVVEKGLR